MTGIADKYGSTYGGEEARNSEVEISERQDNGEIKKYERLLGWKKTRTSEEMQDNEKTSVKVTEVQAQQYWMKNTLTVSPTINMAMRGSNSDLVSVSEIGSNPSVSSVGND